MDRALEQLLDLVRRHLSELLGELRSHHTHADELVASPYSLVLLGLAQHFSLCSGERCAFNRSTNRSALSFSGILDHPTANERLFRRGLLQDAKPEVRHPASNDQCSRHHITDSTIARRILMPLPRLLFQRASCHTATLIAHADALFTQPAEGEFMFTSPLQVLGSSLMRSSASLDVNPAKCWLGHGLRGGPMRKVIASELVSLDGVVGRRRIGTYNASKPDGRGDRGCYGRL